MENNSYVYIHVRVDNYEPFYVGIGKTDNFKRAREKSRRSNFWKNIVLKTDYFIRIIKTNISWEEACELEELSISLYGRRDMKTGILVNMTNGGDGNIGQSEEQIKRRVANTVFKKGRESATWGRKHTEEEKQKMRGKRESIAGKNHPQYGKKRPEISKLMKERIGKNNPNYGKKACNAKIVINIETGIFYESAKEASLYNNIEYSNLKKYLSGIYNINKINLRYT
jgi:hypothetical protein